MKYLQGSFSVGYTKKYADGYDRAFGKKPERELKEPKPCGCGPKFLSHGRVRWITCKEHSK